MTIIGRTKACIALVGLMLIGLVCSCSKGDEDNDFVKESASFEIVSYMPYFEDYFLQTRAGGVNDSYGSMTRAWTLPDGYTAYEGDAQTICACFTENGQPPNIRYFFKSSGKWRIDKTDGIESKTYYLYGYVPHVPSIHCTITDLDGGQTKFDEGAKMTLQNVPSVMSGDLCVVIGAKDGDSDGTYIDVNGNGTYDDGVDTRTNLLRRGDFAYKASSTATNNYVFLLFDHLYASLRIRMRIQAKYNELRTIKLRSLQLSTKSGDETTKKSMDIVIKLQKTSDSSVDPIIHPITYTQTGEINDDGLVFWSSASGRELTTDYQPFIGNFMPENVTTLILTSVYDVYDKKGNLVREDCKATNTLEISRLVSGKTYTERGIRYTIDMTVQPTYLYVLSEPDLNSPTVVLN